MHKTLFSSLGLLLLFGCIPVNPGMINNERKGYNEAVLKSAEEQLLLNIVRMRYTDTPFFMSIDSVTASYSKSLSASVSLSGSWDPTGGQSDSLSISGSLNGSFSPNTTYVPVEGQGSVKQLHSPISLNAIYQMLRSGWSVSRIFRITVQFFGDFPNAPSASRPSTKYTPDFEEFIKRIHNLRDIQIKDDSIYEYFTDQSIPILLMQFPDKPSINPQNFPHVEQLGFDFESKSLLLTDANIRSETPLQFGTRKVIPVQTRSTLGIMYYFSKSIEIPEEHYREGLVEKTINKDGTPFDWSKDLTRGVIAIKSSILRPTNAIIAVRHRDYWFYISDSDADSKESFSLLMQLGDFQQQEGTLYIPTISLKLNVP